MGSPQIEGGSQLAAIIVAGNLEVFNWICICHSWSFFWQHVLGLIVQPIELTIEVF